jgi:signal transduction histidine kinase
MSSVAGPVGLPPLRVSWALAIAMTAMVLGIGAVAIVLGSDHYGDQSLWAVFLPLLGWSFVGTGLYAWARRPESRVGLLMVLLGLAWSLKALKASDAPLMYTLGLPLAGVYAAVFIHLLLSFPTGRLDTAAQRVVVRAAYGILGLAVVPFLLVADRSDPRFGCEDACPRNLLLVHRDETAADAYVAVATVVGVGLLVAVFVLVVARWRAASAPLRRILAPVLVTGGAAVVCFALASATGTTSLTWAGFSLLVAIPFGFLAGLLRARLGRQAVSSLLAELEHDPAPGDLRDALARALRDPSLVLAYWVGEYDAFVDLDGHRLELVESGTRAVTVIDRGGRQLAALVHDASLREDPELLDAVAAAAGIALENAQLHAELRARVDELRGSSARILEATLTERQRLERNLHDGAQQRLVALALELGMLQKHFSNDPEAKDRLEQVRGEAAQCLRELRELARGLHPAVVTDHGLAVALEGLAARSPVPVTIDVHLEERLPEAIEVAAYFLVAESLTNVAKYARATKAGVSVGRADGRVVIEIVDDGVGGARIDGGSGLRGLADRMQALEGTLRVFSPESRGTRLRAEIPCA